MTATTQDIKPDKLGVEDIPTPQLLALPIEANVIIYGGTPVFNDAAGFAVDGTPASAGLMCWGRCERQVNNLTTNAPFGAQGAQQVTIRPGAYYFASDGSVTAAQVGKAVFALDNQTCCSTPVQTIASTVWLPYLGLVQPPGLNEAGLNLTGLGKVPVYLGYPAPGTSMVLHCAVSVTLANIQAQTSGAAFTITPPMPANSRLLEAQIVNTQAFAGGGASAMTATLQGGADAAGTIIASGTVLAAGAINAAPGSNPYQSRAAQNIKMTLTETGGTLATLTAGALTVDLFYTIAF